MRRPDDDVMTAVVARLQKRLFEYTHKVDRRPMLDMRLTEVADYTGRELERAIYRFTAYAWAERIQHEEQLVHHEFHVDMPVDWWQHFKERWFPRWAIRRWPVRTKRHTEIAETKVKFECHALLPGFRYQPPPGGDRDDYVMQTSAWSQDLPRQSESFGDYTKRMLGVDHAVKVSKRPPRKPRGKR